MDGGSLTSSKLANGLTLSGNMCTGRMHHVVLKKNGMNMQSIGRGSLG